MDRGQTVLVVEDHEDTLQALRELLEEEGFRVRVARDGLEAWEQLTLVRPLPDALVLDLMLPNLSGPELLRRMEKDAALSKVPVVTMTAGAVKPTPGRVLLRKPLALDELVATVAACCAGSTAA